MEESLIRGLGMRPLRLALPLVLWLCGSACGSETTCSVEESCPAGLFCEAGECVSSCNPAVQRCVVGVCTQDGRCARNFPDPDAGVCAAMVLEAEFGIPTVVLLVDQSGSMDQPYSGDTRWNVLEAALIDPTDGVVTRRQGEMRFGLTLYTGSGTPDDPDCPELTVVDPALDNRDAIAAVYEPEGPQGDTPTGDAIDAVVASLADFSEPGPKYIILATDGEPDTCEEPNPQNGQAESVAAAEAAFAAGVTLFILSVGEGTISAEHLQDVANAGVGLPVGGATNASYWEAGDATQLAEAFDAITARLVSCELMVNGVIEPDAIDTGIIYLDGNQLELDDPNGWEPIDESSFRLLGDACTNAQREGDHTITAEFACEPTNRSDLSAEGGGVIDPGCGASAPAPVSAAVLILVAMAGLRRRRRNS